MTQIDQVRIDGLSVRQARELEEELSQFQPSFVQGDTEDPNRYKDMGLTATIILGAAAIQALSIWLAKRRIKIGEEAEMSIEHKSETGTTNVKIKVKKTYTSSEAPDPETIKQISISNQESIVQAVQSALKGAKPQP